MGLDDMIAGNKQDKLITMTEIKYQIRKSKRDAWMQQVKHITLITIPR